MHRVLLTAPLIFALALSLVFSGFATAARAQDDAAPSNQEEAAEGVIFEFLGFGPSSELGLTGNVVLTRIIFEPGAVLPLLEEDPEPGVLVTEEGTLTILLEDASLNVLSIEDGSFEAEEVEAGTEYELEPGFSVVIPANENGEIRNDTDEEAVGLAAIVVPDEEGSADEDGPDDGGSDDASDEDASEDSDDADGDPSTGEVEVTISDFTFEPATLEIEAGTTVVWSNLDAAPHTASANNGTWDSDTLGEGDTFSMTFDDPGTYEYGCVFHPSMEGSIVVT